MTTNNNSNLVLIAGGYDAEMVEIINLCREAGVEVVDKHLPWYNAKIEAYSEEIAKLASEGKIPVLVELAGAEKIAGGIVIDHHNANAGRPASILQVLDMLGLEPTRRQLLIAANDSGYIPGMLALGATAEEVAEVRLLDRSAQGITPEQEAEAKRAIAAAEEVNGVTIIRMAHSKTATVTDRLFDESKPQNLLIISADGETNYYGPEDICRALQGNKVGERPAPWDPNQTETLYDHFGGWIGGAGIGKEGGTGFWGGYADQKAVETFVTEWFAK